MRRSSPRSVAAATALAIAATMLAACSDDSSGEPGPSGAQTGRSLPSQAAMADYGVGTTFKATEPLQISLMYREHPNYPLKGDWLFVRALQDNQNVTFDYVNVPLSDWNTQKPTIIGSGDVPDLIPVTYTAEQSRYAGGGSILPISDYVQYMPNLQDKIAKWDLGPEMANIKLASGQYYVLPGIHEKARSQYSIAIREEYWKQAGITSDPTTWDELEADLQKIKDAKIPGVKYPLSDRWQMKSLLNQAAPGFNTTSGFDWGFGNGVFWDDKDGAFVYSGATDEQRQLLTYFAGLVKKGLLDPESFTQDDDQAIQKFGNGESATISTNDQVIDNEYRKTFSDLGNTTAKVRQIRVPAGPAGDLYPYGGRLESGLMISAAAAQKPYFKALLQFVDWLYYSDEGLEFAKWGVEGTTFTKDAAGKRTLVDGIGYNAIHPEASKKLNVDFGFSNGEWMLAQGTTWDLDTSFLNDESLTFLKAMSSKKIMPPAPPAPLTPDQSDEAAQYQTQLYDIVTQNTAAFITGTKDIAKDWDAHVKALKDAGMEAYLTIYNEAREAAAK
ncbi:MAG TPA: extracellular solute-binding protein [Cellulomonas sp.]